MDGLGGAMMLPLPTIGVKRGHAWSDDKPSLPGEAGHWPMDKEGLETNELIAAIPAHLAAAASFGAQAHLA